MPGRHRGSKGSEAPRTLPPAWFGQEGGSRWLAPCPGIVLGLNGQQPRFSGDWKPFPSALLAWGGWEGSARTRWGGNRLSGGGGGDTAGGSWEPGINSGLNFCSPQACGTGRAPSHERGCWFELGKQRHGCVLQWGSREPRGGDQPWRLPPCWGLSLCREQAGGPQEVVLSCAGSKWQQGQADQEAGGPLAGSLPWGCLSAGSSLAVCLSFPVWAATGKGGQAQEMQLAVIPEPGGMG